MSYLPSKVLAEIYHLMYSFSFPIINHKKTVRNCRTREKKSALIFIEIEYSPNSFRSLLYGPPGLGKTTLAHVVANHAGYNVVEINASDDREYSANKIIYLCENRTETENGNFPNPSISRFFKLLYLTKI